jgi:flagellin
MPQTINTNTASLNAQRNLNMSQTAQATAMQRLSSGLRVNSAKDDAAGLAIAERMSSQVRGMNVAIRNANDAISLAQTAEGALGKIGDNLQRMRELALQARNASNSDGDRANLQKEFRQLQLEINRTVEGTTFNGKSLFTGGGAGLEFQIGSGTAISDRIIIEDSTLSGGTAGAASTVGDLITAYDDATDSATRLTATQNIVATITAEWTTGSSGVAIGGSADIDPEVDIDGSITLIDKSLDIINDIRSTFGAAQNRFEAVIANLMINAENQTAARGRIMDADFAAETASLARAQILQQAGNAMVAQANQLPQQVLNLLQR